MKRDLGCSMTLQQLRYDSGNLTAAQAARIHKNTVAAAVKLHAGNQYVLLACMIALLLIYELCEVNIFSINFHSDNGQVLRKQP